MIISQLKSRIKAPVRRARSKIEDAMDGNQQAVYDDANQEYELQILSKIKDMSDFGLTNVKNPVDNTEESGYLSRVSTISLFRTARRKRRYTGQSRNH